MKKLLLKFAHFILKKYSVIPLEFKDQVLYQGRVYKIQAATIHQDLDKTELELKMNDRLDLLNWYMGE